MKERLLIAENNLVNMICALTAFDGCKNVEVSDVCGTVNIALKMIEEFHPTMALLDIHLNEKGLGTDIGEALKEKGIPFLYVTGVGENPSHECIDAIEIQDENLKTIKRFGKTDKDLEIWQEAYEILKKRME